MQPFRFSVSWLKQARIISQLVLFAFWTALLSAALSDLAQTQTGQTRPLPFDPLTSEERELAGRLATADSRVKERLGTARQRLISVELAPVKSANPQTETARHAEVTFYRYDTDQGLRALVDLGQRTVREVTTISGTAVKLSQAEVAEAFSLAKQNRQVNQFLGENAERFAVAAAGSDQQYRVEGLRLHSGSSKDPCYRHRCVSLFFRQGAAYLAGVSVTVDLSAQTVRTERSRR